MVGIDFGTSNTVVTSGSQTVLSIPTLLFVDPAHRIEIGHAARRAYGEASRSQGSGAVGFRLFQALKLALKDPGLESTNVFGKQVRIETIVSWYLKALKLAIKTAVPGWDESAIVGRPVELSPDPLIDAALQRRFASAFTEAGFSSVQFVFEPVAAAVHLVGRHLGRVLVFDFGGGTLDVSIARLRGDGIDVETSVGQDLGGYLIDEDLARVRIQRHFGHGSKLRTLAGQWLEVPHEVTGQVVQFKVLPFDEIRRIKRLIPELLQESVEKPKLRGLLAFLERNLSYELYQVLDDAKIQLSTSLSAPVVFEVPPHLSFTELVTLPEFEALLAARVGQAMALVQQALSLAGCTADEVDHVVRVGGSSQIPLFCRNLETLFPGRLVQGNLFEGIALGLLPAADRGLLHS
jgi:hypothetical chaperone protein